MVRQVNKHITRTNVVYLLHLLHESVWSELSDVVGDQSRSAKPTNTTTTHDSSSYVKEQAAVTVGDAERLVRAFLRDNMPLYSLLASKVNRAVNYALNSLQSQERNKLFVYQLIHMITDELKRS